MDASDGVLPSHEECFFAMLALRSKMHFYHRDLMAIAEAYENGKVTGISIDIKW